MDTSFDEAAILDEARRQAGLDEFGDEGFREPLCVLLRSLDREANLHAEGRAAQRARIVESLVARLRAEDHFRRHPEILAEELAPCAVIVGLARTGTTRLHRLLACDPRLYAVLWWECRNPSPLPGADPALPDPRIAMAHAQVEAILEAVPALAAIHPWDAEGPDEEILLLEHSFLSHVPESGADVPSYREWLTHQDLRPAYAYLKRQLQFLQWQKRRAGGQGDGWVLKSPFHLGYLDVLFEVLPGVRVIQTHRDPLETIPSVASMYCALWELATDPVDVKKVGAQCSERFAWALDRCLESRGRLPAERFLDVHYADVGRDPLGEARHIFDFLDRPLTPDAERAMQDWLVANAREKRASHRYTLAQFGFSETGIARDFAAYRERFIAAS